MSRQIFIDLTELTTVKGGKLRYYGIARTVAEIARWFALKYPDARFVVHSADFQQFFEVFPQITDRDKALVDLNVPDFDILRFRRVFHEKGKGEEKLVKLLGPAVAFWNKRKIRNSGLNLTPVDMNGGMLFSAARPKLIIDMIDTRNARGFDLEFHPLIHDMIPMHDYGGHTVLSFPLNFYKDSKYTIENSVQIITNSQFTLDDMVRFANDGKFDLPDDLVPVPLVHECPEGTEEPEIELPESPYFLCVGSLMGRKNLNILLKAMLMQHRRGGKMPRLIIAGAYRKHIARELATDVCSPIVPYVKQVHNPNQTDLIRLYQNAVALLMPSKIEGWGLPAGEALWLGTPAICSTAPVLREVCGDLALYFDPEDAEELLVHMNRLMDDPDYRETLRQKIIAAKPTLRTWEMVADDVHAALTGKAERGAS